MASNQERRNSDEPIVNAAPHNMDPQSKIGFSRRRFLKIVTAAVTGGAAVAFFLKDRIDRGVIRQFSGKQTGVLTLMESELTELAAFAAVLGGLSPKDDGYAAYAKPIIQRAAQELEGIGITLRKTVQYLNEMAEPRFHTLDLKAQEKIMRVLLQPPGLNFLKWIKSRNVGVAESMLLRITLNSPQSWRRLGYTNFPGVLGAQSDYQRPLDNPR
jgi:hypothetical protein